MVERSAFDNLEFKNTPLENLRSILSDADASIEAQSSRSNSTKGIRKEQLMDLLGRLTEASPDTTLQIIAQWLKKSPEFHRTTVDYNMNNNISIKKLENLISNKS